MIGLFFPITWGRKSPELACACTGQASSGVDFINFRWPQALNDRSPEHGDHPIQMMGNYAM
jgi:hypothetical protein